MELSLSLATWQTFLVCLCRMAALVGSIPVFSGSQAPIRVRAALAVTFALVVFPRVKSFIPDIAYLAPNLGYLVATETLLGLMLGFTARLIFTAVQFGGTVVGHQMGFAAANILDPQSQQQVPLFSQFQSVLAMLLFLATDAHYIFFRAIVHSYKILPPGNVDISGKAIPYIMTLAGHMFVLGVKLSIPMMAVLVLSHFILGIMSRIFTQLNVFLLSFPINIGLGFIIFGLSLDLVAAIISQEFNCLGERFIRIFHLMS